MDIGNLYDQSIASTYDRDERGLLSGARQLSFSQIQRHVPATHLRSVLDLAVGTGESLIAMRQLFPIASLHGVDLSEEMLRIAKGKLDFHAIHDDVANAGQYFAPGSMDLVLMHFLTTFVDGTRIVADAAKLVRPGGYFSIVSSTFEAFPRVFALARRFFPEEFIREKNPAPENTETVASFCTQAGLEIVEVERFVKGVSFSSFEDFYAFGMQSGFFTHVLSHLDKTQLASLSGMEEIFPFEDHYCGSVVLARRPT